jgi:transcriptional regulator with XRE-family HTH domain
VSAPTTFDESSGEGRPPGTTEGLGPRLRAAREAQRLTLAELAETAELTKGFVSKVEREVATPSVASLLRLCRALGLSVGELFGQTTDHELIRADAYPPISFGGQDLTESLLTPRRERRLQVIHSHIRPGGGSGEETYELPTDVEFVFVVSGRLALTIDDRVQSLGRGDALTFAPRARHSFTNPSTDEPCEVLWVLTPALPVGGSTGDPEIEWERGPEPSVRG